MPTYGEVGRRVMWRTCRRCCRPTIDRLIGLVLFGLASITLLTLWTIEMTTQNTDDAEKVRQERLVQQLLLERQRLMSDDQDLGLHSTTRYASSLISARQRQPSTVNSEHGITASRRRQRSRPVTVTTRRTSMSIDTRKHRMIAADSDVSPRCSVYNTSVESTDEFDCIQLHIKPRTTVCLYPDSDDIHVSRHLRQDGLWEPHIVRLFQNLLFQNPDLDVIDVGSHIGQYSLLAATMGRRVIAVEPYMPSVRRLHRAISIAGLSDKIVVLHNAVSDERSTLHLGVPDGNQGGVRVDNEQSRHEETSDAGLVTSVIMNDLAEVTSHVGRRVVMKIDIEGHEQRALRHADQLFDTVHVAYIFMEWIKLRAYYGAEVDDTEDKRLVQRLVDWLTQRGYTAHSLVLFQKLNVNVWYGWPDDIFWQHRDDDPFL